MNAGDLRSARNAQCISWIRLAIFPRICPISFSYHVLASSSPPLGHKLVSHAKQVAQDIGCDPGQANQHGGVVEIVVGHVVDIRVCCEQFGAVIEVNANSK